MKKPLVFCNLRLVALLLLIGLAVMYYIYGDTMLLEIYDGLIENPTVTSTLVSLPPKDDTIHFPNGDKYVVSDDFRFYMNGCHDQYYQLNLTSSSSYFNSNVFNCSKCSDCGDVIRLTQPGIYTVSARMIFRNISNILNRDDKEFDPSSLNSMELHIRNETIVHTEFSTIEVKNTTTAQVVESKCDMNSFYPGMWVNKVWKPDGCSLPTKESIYKLARKNHTSSRKTWIHYVGDSMSRDSFNRLCDLAKVKVVVLERDQINTYPTKMACGINELLFTFHFGSRRYQSRSFDTNFGTRKYEKKCLNYKIWWRRQRRQHLHTYPGDPTTLHCTLAMPHG